MSDANDPPPDGQTPLQDPHRWPPAGTGQPWPPQGRPWPPEGPPPPGREPGWDPSPWPHRPDVAYLHARQVQHASSSATTALILGILGLIVCPLVLSIPAWVIGHNARRESEQLPGRPNWGAANTGYVLGIIGTVMWTLFIVVFVVYVIAFAASLDVIFDESSWRTD
jgi:hypothetical protein